METTSTTSTIPGACVAPEHRTQLPGNTPPHREAAGAPALLQRGERLADEVQQSLMEIEQHMQKIWGWHRAGHLEGQLLRQCVTSLGQVVAGLENILQVSDRDRASSTTAARAA